MYLLNCVKQADCGLYNVAESGDSMKKIILDTDLGSDCDDAGAIAILHNLEDTGEAQILGMTHCASEITGAISLFAINEYYNKKDIPGGQFQDYPFLEGGINVRFTKPVSEDYLKDHSMPKIENATKLLRRLLAENQEVTLVSIGMLNNIKNLIKSMPDEESPLDGVQLIKRSVKELYVMGGNFRDLEDAEYNIKCDTESAIYVAENFPSPIVYAGFELGEGIMTGGNLKKRPENPIARMYHIRVGDKLRESWDPITVYCAIRDKSGLFKKSDRKGISFDETGRVRLSEGDKDCFLLFAEDCDKIRDEIDSLMY